MICHLLPIGVRSATPGISSSYIFVFNEDVLFSNLASLTQSHSESSRLLISQWVRNAPAKIGLLKQFAVKRSIKMPKLRKYGSRHKVSHNKRAARELPQFFMLSTFAEKGWQSGNLLLLQVGCCMTPKLSPHDEL